jgi:hypothetical protein
MAIRTTSHLLVLANERLSLQSYRRLHNVILFMRDGTWEVPFWLTRQDIIRIYFGWRYCTEKTSQFYYSIIQELSLHSTTSWPIIFISMYRLHYCFQHSRHYLLYVKDRGTLDDRDRHQARPKSKRQRWSVINLFHSLWWLRSTIPV